MKQGGDDNDNDASARCPPHPGFVHGLCSRCGAEEEKAGGSTPGLAVGHETMNQGGDGGGDDDDDSACCHPHPEIVQSLGYQCGAAEEDAGGSASGVTVADNNRAAGKRIAGSDSDMETWTFIRERKLILILDLHHTLLDCTGLHDLSPAEQAKGLTSGDPRNHLFRLNPDNLGMLVKLRPFVRGFLEQASSMFKMHVYTHGNQVYAKAAMDLLDPTGVYFGGRVVFLEESSQRDTKSLGVIPDADPVAVVMLHDRLDAWPLHLGNLILTDRYRYFASTCRKSGHDIPSLAEQGLDDDDSLAVALGVLKRVHQAFFDDGPRTDVREVIAELRGQVLRGCTVTFSYLKQRMENSPDDTRLWTLAERLGAVCRKDVDETVTHVVAEDLGTQKAQWAREHGKFLVNPEWIKAASFLWCRGDEQKFPVTVNLTPLERVLAATLAYYGLSSSR